MKKVALVLALILSVSVIAFAAPTHDWQENYGKVGRLYPVAAGYYFTLVGGKTTMNPASGYYFLEKSHANYDKLAELIFWSAAYGWKINVHCKPAKNARGHAVIDYLLVDTNNR
ncbi:MAG TPA: hypothetical protein ENN84_04250 [Candidatus Marinimicrobia bacterium]|nr:hypothetical protein [Candidatus Neomarinimicrobiota bacterium]